MADVTALIEQLRDEHIEVRTAAAQELAQIGESAQVAALQLVQATGDAESVSVWAVSALEELGPPAPEATAQLADLISSDQELIGYWAVTLLGRLGADAASVEQALAAALHSSPYLSVRQRSAWALGQLGSLSSATVSSLRSAVADPDPRLAQLAGRALTSCGMEP